MEMKVLECFNQFNLPEWLNIRGFILPVAQTRGPQTASCLGAPQS